MRADDDDFVGMFAAGNLGDHVGDLDVLANAIGQRELHRNAALPEKASDQERILQTDLGLRHSRDPTAKIQRTLRLRPLRAAGAEDGNRRERTQMLESAELCFERWMVAETCAIEQHDTSLDLILLGIESVDGHARDIQYVGGNSAVRRR